MRRNFFFTILSLFASLSDVAQAGDRSGTVTALFLKLPVNARAAAMGNAQAALAVGASSIPYNPAGILSIKNVSFGGTYNAWFADITHSFIGVAANFQEWGHVGIGVTLLTTDDMIVTTPAFPEGNGQYFRASDYAFTISYARQISLDFRLGLSAKYIQSYLYNTDIGANAIAFDIGSLYDIPALKTTLGISVNNLGRDLKFINEQYSLPSVLRFGAQTNVYREDAHLVNVAFQVTRPNDADEQYNLGVEYVYQDMVSLRAGYRFNYDNEDWSIGAGFSLSGLEIDGTLDYSYTNFKYLTGTHMITVELGF